MLHIDLKLKEYEKDQFFLKLISFFNIIQLSYELKMLLMFISFQLINK